MYRSVTWLVQQNGVDPQDAASIAPLLKDLDLQLRSLPGGGQQVLMNGQDVSDAIRSPEVTASVSAVAAHRCVCLLYTSPSPRDVEESRMPSSA